MMLSTSSLLRHVAARQDSAMQELLLACGAAVLVPSPCSKYRLGWCLPLPCVPEVTV